MKDLAGRAGGDRSGDRLRVQGLEGGFVFVLGDDAAHGAWGDNREELFLEGLFHVAGPLLTESAGSTDDWNVELVNLSFVTTSCTVLFESGNFHVHTVAKISIISCVTQMCKLCQDTLLFLYYGWHFKCTRVNCLLCSSVKCLHYAIILLYMFLGRRQVCWDNSL